MAAGIEQTVGDRVPLRLQCADADQAIDLRHVVGDELRERVDVGGQFRLGGFVRREEAFIAGEQKAAQRAFLFADEPADLLCIVSCLCIADDPLRMLDPVDTRKQIQHERDESYGRDDARPEQQPDIVKKDATKRGFVDAGPQRGMKVLRMACAPCDAGHP